MLVPGHFLYFEFINPKPVKHRRALTLVIAILLMIGNLLIDRWPDTLFYGDSNGYYMHVVSFFIHQDVGHYDETISTLREINPASPDPREDKFGMRLTDRGRRYIKYTLGVPVMETPFFLLAHAYAKLSPRYEANGWSKPYFFIIGFATVFYVTWGFYLLMGVLSRYFSERTIWLVCLSLVLATNLFYHTNYVIMSHGFLFFQHCLLIYLTVRFYDQPRFGRFMAVGAAVGLIALTRVPEVVSAVVPVLWGVVNWKSFVDRVRFFLKNYAYVLAAILGFFTVFSLQIYYWYYVSGHLVFNPYEGEGFNFAKPKIYEGFFHFKNGWLLYTPIMTLAIFGLFVLRRYAKVAFWPVLSFFILQAYIHYSYYAWTFFPGLGQRPMVETYPLLSFALAAAFTFFLKRKSTSWMPYTAFFLFSVLNLFQTWQMREGVIWSERHNAAFYWETFATMKSSLNSLRAYDTKELQPEEDAIQKIAVMAQESFDQHTFPDSILSDSHSHSGQYAYYHPQTYFTLSEKKLNDLEPGAWLKMEIWAYMDEQDQIFNRDGCMNLVIEFFDATGKRQKERNIKISSHLGNDTYSIWIAGLPNQWGKASFYTRIPRKAQKDWTFKVFLLNPYGQKLYLDDFELAYYK